jgi:hypothetical protein
MTPTRDELPTLPQKLINAIGEYGMARTDGVSSIAVQYRWEVLIGGIKDYAFALLSAHQAEHCQCKSCKGGVIHASDCAVHNMPARPNGECDCRASDQTWNEAIEHKLRTLQVGLELIAVVDAADPKRTAEAALIEAGLWEPSQAQEPIKPVSGAVDEWEAFEKWKGYPIPPLNAEGRFDKDYLHREYVAFKAGLSRAQQAPAVSEQSYAYHYHATYQESPGSINHADGIFIGAAPIQTWGQYVAMKECIAKDSGMADVSRVIIQSLTLLSQPAAAPAQFDMAAHLQRQAQWSEATFGPGSRTAGVVDHIRKELREIEADPSDLKEWIDVAILALDGAWRSGASPQEIISALVAKQTKNEGRVWPDWKTADPNKAIEHDRSCDKPAAAPVSEQPAVAHPDDAAVDRFAVAMKDKLAVKRTQGRGGWQTCPEHELWIMLDNHVHKRNADPIDVGNFAMMIHQRDKEPAAATYEPSEQAKEPK